MLLSTVMLILKGDNNLRGIGLLEVAWKVIEGVMDRRIKGVELHDSLYRFRQKRGCGTWTLEAKLVQQMASIEQCPLYSLFLDIRKAYAVMDRSRCV